VQLSSSHYLVITALGKDRSGIINTITHQVSLAGCNIEDSRFALFGDNFTFIMMLSGDWQAISQIELVLPKLGVELDLLIVMKRTLAMDREPIDSVMRLQIEVPDSPGLIQRFTQLFDPKESNIAELISKTESKPASQDTILNIKMSVQLAASADLKQIEKRVQSLCRTLNGHYTISMIEHVLPNE